MLLVINTICRLFPAAGTAHDDSKIVILILISDQGLTNGCDMMKDHFSTLPRQHL